MALTIIPARVPALAVVLAFLLTARAEAASQTLYMWNDPRETSKNNTLWTFDVASQKATKLTLGGDAVSALGSDDSGMAYCNDKLFSVWASAEEGRWALVVTDLSEKTNKVVQTPLLFHSMWCDPETPGALLVISSQPSSGGAQFSVARFHPSSGSFQQLYIVPRSFYPGFDSIFGFQASTGRFTFSMQTALGKGNDIFAWNMKTNASSTYKRALMVHPEALIMWINEAVEGSTTAGLDKIPTTDSSIDMYWSTVTFDDKAGKFNVEHVKKEPLSFYNFGLPIASCGNDVYLVSSTGKTLTAVNAQTGEQTFVFDLSQLSPDVDFGSSVCVSM